MQVKVNSLLFSEAEGIWCGHTAAPGGGRTEEAEDPLVLAGCGGLKIWALKLGSKWPPQAEMLLPQEPYWEVGTEATAPKDLGVGRGGSEQGVPVAEHRPGPASLYLQEEKMRPHAAHPSLTPLSVLLDSHQDYRGSGCSPTLTRALDGWAWDLQRGLG